LSNKAGQAQDWYNQAWSNIQQEELNHLNEAYNVAFEKSKLNNNREE
jgi:hypothetical protein